MEIKAEREKTAVEQLPSEGRGSASDGWFHGFVFKLTPERLMGVMAVLVFAAEILDMFILDLMPPLSDGLEAVLDSTILLLMLSPVYFLVFRPFMMERKRSEEEIRQLSRQLIRAEETTRKSLARDLHDEFGQGLTALQLGVETLKISLPAEEEKLVGLCGRLSGMIAQLGSHVRHITSELRPAMLDSLGLVPTLRWFARQFRQRYPSTTVDVKIMDGIGRLSPEIEIALYRICQESLNNVAKHAMARQVRITLIRTASLLTLAIEDDGRGFNSGHWRETASEHQGYGILGMRERLAELGGELTLVSSPGEGTIVRAQVPLAPKE